MRFLTLPESIPWLFWLIAIVWSVSHGVAGYQYGTYICDKARPDVAKGVRCVYGGHHAMLYFTTSFSGFVAWPLLTSLSSRIADWSQVPVSAATLFVAIAAFAVLGVSGALARILHTGLKPW